MRTTHTTFSITSLIVVMLMILSCSKPHADVSGELKKWHTVTITFDGPMTDEAASPNPFTDYRLEVIFVNGGETFVIPGYYAADGNAGETSAGDGNKWCVKFVPNKEGTWTYTASFRYGEMIAISDDPNAGEPVFFNGERGSFTVQPTDKPGNDLRAKGRLQYVGDRYLQFSETREYFLKGGADSPENFLGYEDFDGTRYAGDKQQRMGEASPNTSLHTYAPHAADWKEGDPVWQNGKGKSMIGALNYLASKGMNSVYFLTLNIEGDGEDVWPYTDYEERARFDCSKLDQWEMVFNHMDKLGLMLHIVTQETENELLLDNGDTGPMRKLYYRELIARFAHHLAITWNMGEENGYADFTPNAQNRQQQKDMIEYIKKRDPYKNFVALHTHSSSKYRYEILHDLLGFEHLDGPSVQIGSPLDAHTETLVWTEKSRTAGKPWVVNIDEIGPADRGVDPDDRQDRNNQDTVRAYVLWANLMAGGGGVEWYFGYKNHNNDLGCEDWRSRDRMWDYTRYALTFFHDHLPFWKMYPVDELMGDEVPNFCLAEQGSLYAIYLPAGGSVSLDLTGQEGSYEIHWYNPRTGGELKKGTLAEIEGSKKQSIGNPPADPKSDWAVLVKKKNG